MYGRRRRHAGRLAAVIVVVISLAAGPARLPSRPDVARAQTAEDPTLLRELAERLLLPPFGGPPGFTPSIRLLPGALPSGLPFDPPLPPGSRLIGSAVRAGLPRPPGAPNTESVEIILDAPGSPLEVAAFLDGALAERGLTPPSQPFGPPRPSGFQPTLAPMSRFFCARDGGVSVNVNVVPRQAGGSDVRLNVSPGPEGPGPCDGTAVAPRPLFGPPGFDLIPALYAPAGVEIFYGTGGPRPAPGPFPGPGTFVSEAIAETSVSVAELEARFAEQLAAAGWTRRAGRADAPLAWSTWSVPGEGEWQGFLYVLDGPGEHRRSLRVQVASPNAPDVPLGR